ncbi:MAG: hypothetical protein L0Z50_08275, partial [Verrucomicrobiales bacterium]|nr:hypothetical protein [Verrucomicrobiales bacterium]
GEISRIYPGRFPPFHGPLRENVDNFFGNFHEREQPCHPPDLLDWNVNAFQGANPRKFSLTEL